MVLVFMVMVMVMVIQVVMGVLVPGGMIVDVGAELTRCKPDHERERTQRRHDAPEDASPKQLTVMRSTCHALSFFQPVRHH